LIADPREDGETLLIASGLIDSDVRFVAIPAKSIWKRCAKAFKPFNDLEAQRISEARNEYLHGPGVGFNSIPMAAWWPRFWAQVAILVNALDLEIEDLVGLDRVDEVEAALARNRKNIEHRAEMLIERARQRVNQHRSGILPARIAEEWSSRSNLTAGLSHSTFEQCPACGAMGHLEGEDVQETEPHYERVAEDDFDAWVNLTVGSDYFSCDECRLILDNYELIAETSLPETFGATGDIANYLEPEYGND
jgi:hypothetical protein